MEMWDANIHDQGFLEAFQRTAGAAYADFMDLSPTVGWNGPGRAGRRLPARMQSGFARVGWNPATHSFHWSLRAERKTLPSRWQPHNRAPCDRWCHLFQAVSPMQQALDLMDLDTAAKAHAGLNSASACIPATRNAKLETGRFWTRYGIAPRNEAPGSGRTSNNTSTLLCFGRFRRCKAE